MKSTISHIALLMMFSILLAACPGRRPPEETVEVPHRRPPIEDGIEIDTPEEAAAADLTEAGILALQEEDLERAEWHFQEAIRIAPSFGPAYYWLARVKYDMEEFARADDLLDRAELLIQDNEEWLERIDELRAAIAAVTG